MTRDSFEGFENEPLSLNKYAYVENSPVNYTDSDGYWKKTIYIGRKLMWIIVATGAAIGVLVGFLGGWWLLAASLATYLSVYAGAFWIGKKGTKITISISKHVQWVKKRHKRGKKYKGGLRKRIYYSFRFSVRKWN
ncbi:hypothetical protein CEN49_26760 [Fischerella thermalis CCMEE 5273]|nr:hypothetical protein CBP20_17055 [Fischerella thermalis WC213]PMB01903.1 hypothetical protein CEN49_26760 [Fischerella thermalis CCMEE 5273]